MNGRVRRVSSDSESMNSNKSRISFSNWHCYDLALPTKLHIPVYKVIYYIDDNNERQVTFAIFRMNHDYYIEECVNDVKIIDT